MRILIAEDDAVLRRLLQALLTKRGYETVIACDGQEAWDILRSPGSPRLCIIDWMMPGMDGTQICRNIRLQNDINYKYILLLTAKSRKEDVIEGINAGADDYITKPFNASELEARLRSGKRIIELQEELIAAKEKLVEQATHDPLTGLPNRLLFSDRLTQHMALARRNKTSLTVMYLDLDKFKYINDTLGHNIGDLLLKETAARLSECVRESDFLARMGGDEFTVVLSSDPSNESAEAVTKRVFDAMSAPFIFANREYFITPSIGISSFPEHGDSVEVLVRNADTAMYEAKGLGGNRYHVYTPSLNIAATTKVTLANDLRRAVEREEFRLHYQPIVDIESGRIFGVEALLRWQHPTLGMVSPLDFIRLAEDNGLIIPISEWVLRTACSQSVAWKRSGIEDVFMSVNVSAKQFEHEDLHENVTKILGETGFCPSSLCLELTESTLIENSGNAARALSRLREMGVCISIDDFGTGYSSLSYLKRFPIQMVKIDKSFINEITTNPDDAAIAGAVIAMAHSLGLRVVAEGVETLAQLEIIKSLGCDSMQGFFISKPLPSEEIEQILLGIISSGIQKAA